MVEHKYEYFYDYGNNSIFKILNVYGNNYQWVTVCGNNKDTTWWASGYDSLFYSKNIVFGNLETLKVLYVQK